MSSRIWPATTGHSADNPQLCGLSGRPIEVGDQCLYLTCAGDSARPESQITYLRTERRGRRSSRISGTRNGTEYRSVATGRFRCRRGTCRREYDSYRAHCTCRAKVQPIYKWQERRGGAWHDVLVWERAVLAEEARNRGYALPGGHTVAQKGSRLEGHAHTVAEQPEHQLQALARAGADEEAAAIEAAATVEPETAPPAPLADAIAGLNSASADLARQADAAAARPTPGWVDVLARQPEAVEEREASARAREEQRQRNLARAQEIASRNRNEPNALVPDPERAVARIAALDLEDVEPVTVPDDDDDGGRGAARFGNLLLD